MKKAGEIREKGRRQKIPLAEVITKVGFYLDLEMKSILSSSRRKEVSEARSIISRLALEDMGYSASEVAPNVPPFDMSYSKSQNPKKEVKEMPARQDITLENIYKIVVDLQRDVAMIKKSLIEEPELRDDFILRMRDIDLEKTIIVEDFGKRYGLT